MFEEPGGKICGEGVMHFCEEPFDVLDYYPLVDDNGDFSDFAEVEALGGVQKEGNKSATNKLHVGLKPDFKGFIKACVDFTIAKTKFNECDARIGSSGSDARITSSGKNAVIMAAGYNSIAKAKIGSWITLAEWVKTDETDENGYIIWKPKCVKTEYVDGERIKEDCFYRLENGEFTEVEQEE